MAKKRARTRPRSEEALGDRPAGALDVYVRGRAMVAMRRIQAEARRTGKDRMALREINEVIRKTRIERARPSA